MTVFAFTLDTTSSFHSLVKAREMGATVEIDPAASHLSVCIDLHTDPPAKLELRSDGTWSVVLVSHFSSN